MVVIKLLLILVLCNLASSFALNGGKSSLGSLHGGHLHASAKKNLKSARNEHTRVSVAAAAIPVAAPLISPVTAASLRAVAKLLSTVGLGGYASKQGMLDKNALQVLSKLVFGLLQPCMLFVNVAQTVSGSAGG